VQRSRDVPQEPTFPVILINLTISTRQFRPVFSFLRPTTPMQALGFWVFSPEGSTDFSESFSSPVGRESFHFLCGSFLSTTEICYQRQASSSFLLHFLPYSPPATFALEASSRCHAHFCLPSIPYALFKKLSFPPPPRRFLRTYFPCVSPPPIYRPFGFKQNFRRSPRIGLTSFPTPY